MLTLTVEHNKFFLKYTEVYNNDMFRPYMWAIIRLWLDFQLRRVVVLGCNVTGSRYHYITGYHGPGCIWLDVVFFLFPIGTISYARGCNII